MVIGSNTCLTVESDSRCPVPEHWISTDMSTEAYAGYPPEMNSGRWEAGTGPETWMTAATAWTEFAGIVATATASLMGEIAMMTGATLTGETSVAMLASSIPFIGWLGTCEAVALTQAMACSIVAEAWATATAGIIPLPVVTQNRITEAALQATNVFGVNTPAIGELDREYGQFWTQDGESMMTYDQAVVLATSPKMVTPPPPLGNTASSAGQFASQAGEVASNAAQSASQMSDVGSSMQDMASTSGSSSNPMEMLQTFASPAQSLISSVQGAANPQSLLSPFQQLSSPVQQMLGQFLGGPQMGGGLNGAFGSGLNSSTTGGVPLNFGSNGSTMGGGGLSGGFGGGGAPLGTLNGSSEKVKPIQNLSGVPGPTLGSGNQANANNGRMGGGAGPMGGHGGGNQSHTRKSETITAAHVDESIYERSDTDTERAMFR